MRDGEARQYIPQNPNDYLKTNQFSVAHKNITLSLANKKQEGKKHAAKIYGKFIDFLGAHTYKNSFDIL